MNHVNREEIMTAGGLAGLKAVKEGRVYLLDETLTSRPTPRLILATKTLGAILYPELYPIREVNP